MSGEVKKDGRILEWVDCAKFMAISAVLIDHTGGILYTGSMIATASYYSVSLFVLIAGFLSFLSNERHHYSYPESVLKPCKRILPAYLAAVFFYRVANDRFFDLSAYIDTAIHFNASGPFYYVLLYIQLMLVNRILYHLLISFPKKRNILCEAGLGAVILLISFLTTNYTNICGVYGGGGKLLGGTYLFLFYVGMLFARHNVFENTKPVTIGIFIVSLGAWIGWWQFLCAGGQKIDSLLPFGEGLNPPSLSFGLSAVLMMFLSYGLFSLLSMNPAGKKISGFIAWIGRHTLYIFLYHKLWLDYFLNRYVRISNKFLKFAVFMGTMIFASILTEKALLYLKRKCLPVKGKEKETGE